MAQGNKTPPPTCPFSERSAADFRIQTPALVPVNLPIQLLASAALPWSLVLQVLASLSPILVLSHLLPAPTSSLTFHFLLLCLEGLCFQDSTHNSFPSSSRFISFHSPEFTNDLCAIIRNHILHNQGKTHVHGSSPFIFLLFHESILRFRSVLSAPACSILSLQCLVVSLNAWVQTIVFFCFFLNLKSSLLCSLFQFMASPSTCFPKMKIWKPSGI